jgi:endoglucanase
LLAASLCITLCLFAGCTSPPSAHEVNRSLGRGINLGNALEAPAVGAWGVTPEEEYFNHIAEAGFDAVRIPVRWSAHAECVPPYTIDPDFLALVDRTVQHALDRGLLVVLNVHHYTELMEDPDGHHDRFLSLWRQLTAHYADAPPELLFELLNEPCGKLTPTRWNRLLKETIPIVRERHPHRILVVGTAEWGGLAKLQKLELPAEDRALIVTFHYYEPFKFTHQGASWIGDSEPWLGTAWEGTARERDAIRKDMQKAYNWSLKHNRPLFMGEFGAYSKADMTSRARWTAWVVECAEQFGFSWAYWEFCSGFGAYDADAERWRQPLLDALQPPVN